MKPGESHLYCTLLLTQKYLLQLTRKKATQHLFWICCITLTVRSAKWRGNWKALRDASLAPSSSITTVSFVPAAFECLNTSHDLHVCIFAWISSASATPTKTEPESVLLCQLRHAELCQKSLFACDITSYTWCVPCCLPIVCISTLAC